MDQGTLMGGKNQSFPKTRWSVIREAGDPESPGYRESLENLATIYWKPVYAHLRRKWGKSNEEAKDFTQDFFAHLCEKDVLGGLCQERGRFRSYVMVALDNFVKMDHRREGRAKRGGGAVHLSLEATESFEPSKGGTPERDFMRDWARTVLDEALKEMREKYRILGTDKVFDLFMLRDIQAPAEVDLSYEGLAKRFGMTPVDVTNHLYRARQHLRQLVLSKVRDTVATEAEAEDEMRDLFEPVA